MPQDRQKPAQGAGEESIAVRSLGLRLPPDHRIATHTHPWHQLVYASEGVMRVETPSGNWVVPPERAVWIPAGFAHAIRMTGAVRMQTLYLRPGLAPDLPVDCGVVSVSALLRELVLETLRRGMLRDTIPEQARLAAVLIDQILHTRDVALQLTFPSDPRAQHVARKAQKHMSRASTVAELARGSGASARTIERLFLQETGVTFGRWLQRAKALHALERLAAGDSVTAAGLAIGYSSTSAFITMFQRVVGTTPGNFLRRGVYG
jgi:AraC-like DNA-binding protein